MLFQDSEDESAIGLALVGLFVVGMAAFLGVVTGNVQPKAPVPVSHFDVSSPGMREKVALPATPSNESSSPYPQPGK